MPTIFEWTITIILPLIPSACAVFTTIGSGSYLGQWCLYMFLDATYGHLFHAIILIPARQIASRLPGSKVPPLDDESKLSEQEEQSNDPSLVWPSPAVVAKLPVDWRIEVRELADPEQEESSAGSTTAEEKNTTDCPSSDRIRRFDDRDDDERSKSKTKASPSSRPSKNKKKKNGPSPRSASKKRTTTTASPAVHSDDRSDRRNAQRHHQPYYLNHVRGSTRIRQASQRVAAAFGTLLSSHLLCSRDGSSSSSLVSLEDVGLGVTSSREALSDFGWGFVVGTSIVALVFLVELRMGWIRIVGYWETVVPTERFAANIAWDVLFHLGVSFNEEVMLRGWMLVLGCRGLASYQFFDDPSATADFAIVASVLLQSALFALMHASSPGSTAISLLNLFLGGIAASLNVMVAGGSLWLGIGWHFGWNISMGHVLGRGTSGIPMGCAAVSVLPRPRASYERYHGGTFGPERGVLAPLAYATGMAMVVWLYGWEQLGAWRERLVAMNSSDSTR